MTEPDLTQETPGVQPSPEGSSGSEPEDLKKEPEGPKEKIEDLHAKQYPMRYTIIPLPGGEEGYLNAVTSLFGFVFLWGLAIWCMVDPEGSYDKLSAWKNDVTQMFTWFYIVANPAFTFFVFWLAIRYG